MYVTVPTKVPAICMVESRSFAMPKSVSLTSPARLCRMFSGLMSLWRSFLSWRYFRPSMICCVMLESICGSTPAPCSRFLRSAKLPRSINSSTTLTVLVVLVTKPAYHCTRFGQPSARTRPLMSFKSCSRLSLSSTLTCLIATGCPVSLMVPLDTTPQAPAPKCEPASGSMSSADNLYSRPSNEMPSSGDTFIPVGLWRKVPFGPTDHRSDTDISSSMSSNWRFISAKVWGSTFRRCGVAIQQAFCSYQEPNPHIGTPA
mmetsp:Transcript_40154/g.54546  ORF Transcript_40154/g.54546 Transcript_40154/m.54546 type:complete len:259 (-) Transcript_40154:18-794(-)